MKCRSVIILFFIFNSVLLAGTPLVDELGINVSGAARQFAYTNKQAGTYYGEVNSQNSGGWQGWFVNAQKILDDYTLELNGMPIDRATAATTVFPYQVVRKYPDGAEERFTFLDSVNAVVVEYTFTKEKIPTITLHPLPGLNKSKVRRLLSLFGK